MLETRAFVISVHGKEAMVEAIGQGGCGHCNSEKGCGSGKLTQLFCSKQRQFKVLNEAQATIGDEVQVTLQDGVLLRSSMLVYVLPLGLLLAGGMVGASFSSEVASKDGIAAAGSFVGLVLGFFLARRISSRQSTMAVAHALNSATS